MVCCTPPPKTLSPPPPSKKERNRKTTLVFFPASTGKRNVLTFRIGQDGRFGEPLFSKDRRGYLRRQNYQNRFGIGTTGLWKVIGSEVVNRGEKGRRGWQKEKVLKNEGCRDMGKNKQAQSRPNTMH